MAKKLKALSKADILGADDLPREQVNVPEWGGAVHVRSLTGAERDDFEASMFEGQGKKARMNSKNLRARLVALCVVDADGERIFADGDVEALGRKSAAALDRVFSAAQRLNGFTQADIEELEGNSETAPSDASTSASPASSA
jgi:hypothetical protein